MENKKIVTNSEWLDDMTFLVNFKPIPTTEDFELEGVVEEVVVEYHADENKWVVDKQYFDAEGGFIDHDTDAFTPYEKAEYLTIAVEEYKKLHTDDSWAEVVDGIKGLLSELENKIKKKQHEEVYSICLNIIFGVELRCTQW